MKRFLRASGTKAIASILIILFVLAGFTAVSYGIKDFEKFDTYFSFDPEFKNSNHAAYMLELPAIYLSNVANASKNGHTALIAELERRAEDLKKEVNIYFYIEYIPDGEESKIVYSNSESQSLREFLDGYEHYSVVRYDGPGKLSYESSCEKFQPRSYLWSFDDGEMKESLVIAATVLPSYAKEVERNWAIQGKLVKDVFFILLGCALGILFLYIYLVCTVGRNKNGERVSMWTDGIYPEVHIGVIVLSAVMYVGAAVNAFDFENIELPEYMITSFYISLAAFATVFFLLSSLSLVRQLKNSIFVKKSLILRIFVWTIKLIKAILKYALKLIKAVARFAGNIFGGIRGLLSKSSRVYAVLLIFAYTCVIGICGIFLTETANAVIWALMLFALCLWFVGKRLADLDNIKGSVRAIRNGKLDTKIVGIKSADMQSLSEDINSIGDGLMSSVSEKLKAEKMKSELITNVSHDLKTPLTSIINYAKLLSDMELVPEEANDYARIISQKSERLKALTNDLFDISKVESGNEKLDIERLNISLLVNQSLAEHESEIKESGLLFITNIQDELYVMADGKKMSRVIANLISNIIKYTLENTRVFISSEAIGTRAVLEFKNISSTPLDIDVEELSRRFVRADRSRSKEGNGLGLAIAKSYSEVCGASFKISSDGDLFKVRIEFDLA